MPEIAVFVTMRRIMRPLQKKFFAVLFLAGLLVAAFWYFHPSLLGLLADHYYAQLNQTDDAEVEKLVDRLASLGTPAIPRLTAALGSERKVVAKAVRAKLLEMVKSWEHPDTRPTAETQLVLADSLAQRVEQYGPSARLHAATIARRMLQISNSGLSHKDASRLLVSCESVLDAAKSVDRLVREELEQNALNTEKNATTAKTKEPAKPRPVGPAGTVPLSERPLTDLARLPGGNLPPPLPDLKSRRLSPEEGGGIAAIPVDRSRQKPNPGSPGTKTPSPGQLRPETNSTGSNPQRDELVSDTPGLRRLPDNPGLRPMEPPTSEATGPTTPRTASANQKDPGDRVYNLIVQLHSNHHQEAEKARRELSLGGFQTVHFALAERLMDPDPEVRKKLISILPRLQSIQAESWLKWLLKDDDPDVRYAALTTLASSSDPTLLTEVAQIARLDADPKIRLEGEQIQSRLTR
ncbi:MAG: HEAT repeat domain-containing protein [Planctomycetia bacterium]